jgi:hypothetical protein
MFGFPRPTDTVGFFFQKSTNIDAITVRGAPMCAYCT